MSISSICPDDLLLAARRGELSPDAEARLAFHLERCARCRAALETGRAFDVVLGARAGDDEIAMRIAVRVTERKSSRFWPLAIGAGLMLSASLAVAAVGVQRFRMIFEDVDNTEQPRAAPSQSPSTHGLSRKHGTRPEMASSEPPPQAALPETLPGDTLTPSSSISPALSAPSSRSRGEPSRTTANAAELFAQANALRGASKNQEAQKRYLELQAHYPDTAEARVSLVSLGRLELATQPAQALRHFNAYLAQSKHRTLNEEALFGQATALGRLGKLEAEKAAWHQLLERYPSSVYADRAKARLAP